MKKRKSGRDNTPILLAVFFVVFVLLFFVYSNRIFVNRYYNFLFAYFNEEVPDDFQYIRPEGFVKTPFPAEYSCHGIDISRYQGYIDWKVLKKENISFAFIKATEGEDLKDDFFDRNWPKSKSAGILRGAYHFYIPSRDPVIQAEHFISNVTLQVGDLPPVLDVEITAHQNKDQIRNGIHSWLQIVEDYYGVKPIIYTNYDFYQNYIAGHFDDYRLWIAHYKTNKPRLTKKKWAIWQHSDKAYVEGIYGTVDLNVYNGPLDSLSSLCITEEIITLKQRYRPATMQP